MKNTIARLISVAVLGAAATGCATVPGDPYYEPAPYRVSGQPSYIYNTPPVYSSPQPVYPAYSPPPAVIYYGQSERDDRWERDRNRNDLRERERDRAERDRASRDRAERDRAARDLDRNRRDQQAREVDRRQRDRDQAQREQAERERRAAEDRRYRDSQSGNAMPHPQDWRARQQSNSFDKP